MSVKKITIGIIFLMLLIMGCLWWFLKMDEIPKSADWSADVKRYANPVTGLIKVTDEKSGKTIFFYSDEPVVYPTQVEKISDDEWRVTFKKRKN